MKNVTVQYNGREYPALETRNITAGNAVCKKYDGYKIKGCHNGLISKFTLKPNSYWDDAISAGSFHYDLSNDRITWFLWSDYDPAFLFIFVDMVKVLDDCDVVIVSVKRGRMIDRYRIKVSDLCPLIGAGTTKYGLYPVNKDGFEKLKSKVWRGDYAKR